MSPVDAVKRAPWRWQIIYEQAQISHIILWDEITVISVYALLFVSFSFGGVQWDFFSNEKAPWRNKGWEIPSCLKQQTCWDWINSTSAGCRQVHSILLQSLVYPRQGQEFSFQAVDCFDVLCDSQNTDELFVAVLWMNVFSVLQIHTIHLLAPCSSFQ